MGYTHYWDNKQIPPDVWEKIRQDAAKLIAASSVPLELEYDDAGTAPTANDQEVRFNGVGEDGHETFGIHPAPTKFDFCKTAHKPYDIVVCAILAVFAEHGGVLVSISSDGDSTDWADGIAFASTTLGRPIACPL